MDKFKYQQSSTKEDARRMKRYIYVYILGIFIQTAGDYNYTDKFKYQQSSTKEAARRMKRYIYVYNSYIQTAGGTSLYIL